ncbi:MAG: ggdef domain/hd domain protein [bacterium]|nr:MAG: ggdef domain/hd domain protein [bacterium]
MPSALRKVGFLCLPDRQLDLFSAVTRQSGFRAELVVDANPASCAVKMAEILEIPASGELSLFRRYPCDIIVIPDDRPDLQVDICQVLGPALSSIMTCREMTAMLGLVDEVDADVGPSTWLLPLAGLAGSGMINPPGDRTAVGSVDQTSTSGTAEPAAPEDDRLDIVRHPFESLDEPVDDTPEASAEPSEAPRTRDYERSVMATPAWFDAVESASGDLRQITETLDLAGDQQKLLRRILEIAVRAAGGDSGSIMLLDESGQHLRIVVADGLSEEVIRLTSQRRGDGVAGQVLRDGRARILVDRLDDPRYRSGRERSAIQSAVVAPVKVGGRTIGVLNVSSDSRPNAFTGDSLEQMERFGSEVAGVLLRALRPVDGDRSLERSLDIAVESLMTLDRPLESRLQAVLDRLATTTQAAAARLYLLDGTGRRLEVAAEYGSAAPGHRRAAIMADRGFTARAMEKTTPTILTSNFESTGPRAMLLLPLPTASPMGLIELEDLPAEEPGWSERLAALTTATLRLASRLEFERSQKLLTRRTRQMLRLSDLTGELLAAESAESLARLAVAAAADIVGADLAVWRRRDADGPELSDPALARTESGGTLMWLDMQFGQTALELGRPTMVADCPAELEDRLAADGGVHWAAGFPVPGIAGGVLTIYRFSKSAMLADSEDIALLGRLVTLLGQTLIRLEAGDLPGGDADRFMRWTLFQERIAEEMKRADRYGRSFALLTLDLEGVRPMAETRGGDWLEGARFALTDFVLTHIREIDIPCWVREGRVAILCPETADLRDSFADRLSEEWRQQLAQIKLADLDRMKFTVGEMLYPLDLRDWEATLDWLADRFDARSTVRKTG